MMLNPISKAIVFVFLVLSSASLNTARGDSFALGLRDAPFSHETRDKLKRFLVEVSAAVPSAIKNTLNRPIEVVFAKVGDSEELILPLCAGVSEPSDIAAFDSASPDQKNRGFIHAGWDQGKIQLNALFLKEIEKGPDHSRTYPCGHRNLYRLAMATVLHELVHLYDFGLQRDSDLAGVSGSISSSRAYRKVALWNRWFYLSSLASPRNLSVKRSPDPYEVHHIQEHLAVNLEYYLLDREYSCRRPTLASFFRELLGDPPLFGSDPGCRVNTVVPNGIATLQVRQQGADGVDVPLESEKLVDLDPKRIYQIHFLVAMPGKEWMSNWGHSMFRIVRCAPTRSEVGPDCLKDVSEHMVISYSADLENAPLNSFKGLVGGYSSTLSLFPLSEVIQRYTQVELRDVWSLPLKLSEKEKELFVLKTLENYWEFRGNYRFFTNNCATEAIHHLKASLKPSDSKRFSPRTPMGSIEALSKIGLLDRTVVDSNRQAISGQAISEGYVFPSGVEPLAQAFERTQNYFKVDFPWDTVWDYLSYSTLEQRKGLFSKLGEDSGAAILSDFAVLEGTLFRRKTMRLEKEIVFYLREHQTEIDLFPFVQFYRELLPIHRIAPGYGIPLESEFLTRRPLPTLSAEQFKAYEQWRRERYSDQEKEIQAIETHLKCLLNRSREIRSRESRSRKGVVCKPVSFLKNAVIVRGVSASG